MRTGICVSFSHESLKLINGLQRGELSKICNEAILKLMPERLTLEEAEAEQKALKKQEKEVKDRLKFLRLYIQTQKEAENEKNCIYKKSVVKAEKKKKEKEQEIEKNILFFYEFRDNEANELAKKFCNSNTKESIFQFLNRLGYKDKQKEDIE